MKIGLLSEREEKDHEWVTGSYRYWTGTKGLEGERTGGQGGWGCVNGRQQGEEAGEDEGSSTQGLTCQTSHEASLVWSCHLAKKALENGLQYLQKIP